MTSDQNHRSPHGAGVDPAPLGRGHAAAIEAIALELDLTVDDVAPRYEAVLRALTAEARIGDYLPVLVAKRVREQYRRSASTR